MFVHGPCAGPNFEGKDRLERISCRRFDHFVESHTAVHSRLQSQRLSCPTALFSRTFPHRLILLCNLKTYLSSLSFCLTLSCLLIDLHPALFAVAEQRGESKGKLLQVASRLADFLVNHQERGIPISEAGLQGRRISISEHGRLANIAATRAASRRTPRRRAHYRIFQSQI